VLKNIESIPTLMKSHTSFMKKVLFIALITFTVGCTSLKVKIGAKMSMKNKDNTEIAMNVRPKIHHISSGWSSLFKQNMNDAWKNLHLKGINYFLLGKPSILRGYVSRADINSKFYQAWFGVYVIQAKENVFGFSNDKINTNPKEGILEYGKVAEHDQVAWLAAMGDPKPFARSISFTPINTIRIDGKEVQFFEGTIESHSDLTNKETSLTNLLGVPKTSKWNKKVDAYHDITLKGIYGIWYNQKDKTIKIVYGCGAITKLKDGTIIENYSGLKDKMLEMAKSITFKKLNVDK